MCGWLASRPAARRSCVDGTPRGFPEGANGSSRARAPFGWKNDPGNIASTHSISAGLDYAAIGPEHAWLRAIGRAEYAHASDADALSAFQLLGRLEGDRKSVV